MLTICESVIIGWVAAIRLGVDVAVLVDNVSKKLVEVVVSLAEALPEFRPRIPDHPILQIIELFNNGGVLNVGRRARYAGCKRTDIPDATHDVFQVVDDSLWNGAIFGDIKGHEVLGDCNTYGNHLALRLADGEGGEGVQELVCAPIVFDLRGGSPDILSIRFG